jgi:non-specific serine/threonine protein kinase
VLCEYHPTNLTAEVASFVGREREVRAVTALLTAGDSRLVTLLGTGGTGKTRLALRAGRDLLPDFRDGVFFVSLASLSSPDLVLPSIAAVLAVKEAQGQELEDVLADHLRSRQLLLILDNFEHVVGAAAAVKHLLEAASDLRVLATSRAPLHVYGEYQLLVPPLAVPDLEHLPAVDELSCYGAVALFVDRARAVRPDFALTEDMAATVAAICSRVDGLPLAIELAASRLRVLSPEALLFRLSSLLSTLTGGPGDVPPRQQTMRATIDWSYQLLPGDEQALLTQVSIFSGSFGLKAVEAVCNPPDDRTRTAIDRLTILVQQGLLDCRDGIGGEPRFSLLETIREYAAERLHATGTAGRIARRHTDYCINLVEQVSAGGGPPGRDRYSQLDQDRDNLRAALRRLFDAGDGRRALHLATLLGPYWTAVSSYREGQRWLEEALSTAPDVPAEEKAQAFSWASWLATLRGALGEGRALGAQGLHHFRLAGSRDIPMGLVMSAIQQGDLKSTREFLERDLEECRSLGDDDGVAACFHWLAEIALYEGNFRRAIAQSQESMARARTQDAHGLLTRTLDICARAFLLTGSLEDAIRLWDEGLRLAMDHSDKRPIAFYLEGFAAAAAHRSDAGRSGRLCGAAASLRQGIDSPLSTQEAAILKRMLEPVRGSSADDTFREATEEGRSMSLPAAIEYALAPAERRGPAR